MSGTLTINPVKITLKADTAKKPYDGKALTAPDYEITSGAFVGEEGLKSVKVEGSQTIVGSSPNKITSYELKDNTKEANYDINVEDGLLTVEPLSEDEKLSITVTAKSDSQTYTGQPHTVEGLQTTEFTVNGVKYTVEGLSAKASGTDAGNYTAEVKGDAVVRDKDGNDVTEQFVVNRMSGTLTINPVSVTITVANDSKVYGTLDPKFESPTVEGLIEDKDLGTITVVRTNSSEETVGTYEDVLDVTYTQNNNYTVTVNKGDFTITQQTINPEDPSNMGVTVNSPSDYEYDGNAHQWKPDVTDKDNNLLDEGTDYIVSYDKDDFTNVTGIITVTIEGTGNYTGTVTRTYQITPRPVTLTSGSASKTYDGTALTNSEVTITSGSLVNASDVTYAAVGSITNVGSSLNRISVSYASEQMARNYVVTLVEGTLTVNTAPTTPPTTPTTPPTTPGTPGTTTDDGATTDEPEVEEVEDEETPLSDGDVEDVEDNATPKGNNGIWALINLIAAIVTVILGLILLLSKRHRNDEEEDEEERQARIERGEEKEQEQKRGWICKVLGVIVAIVSVVFFILTEDMSLPMALTDKWTIWMIVIAIVELVLVLVGRHWKDVDDEDQEQQA